MLSIGQIITSYSLYQSEGLTERINEPPWGRCLQGAVDVRWVVALRCVALRCRRRLTGGSFWTNRAEAHDQLVLSPVRLQEQLRSSRSVH